MLKRNKISDCIHEAKMVRLNNDDISEVTGGIIKDNGSYYQVINISRIGVVRTRVPYGGESGRTKEDAFAEAQRLDAIDYSQPQ